MLIKIATRASALAIWQATHVGEQLHARGYETELVSLSTVGDQDTISPLSEIGGKGVFVKEIQHAVLSGRADIAVHSAKDLPTLTPRNLVLAAFMARGDPRDSLVGSALDDLRSSGTVATGSLRRKVQLLDRRPDLTIVELRGNIDTRLEKLSDVDAIVVANAALTRLERTVDICEVMSVETMIPQVGQGALAIETRDEDDQIRAAVESLNDEATSLCVEAERAFLRRLGGDCSIPAGAYATIDARTHGITMSACLADDAGTMVRHSASRVDGIQLGTDIADYLRGRVDALNAGTQ